MERMERKEKIISGFLLIVLFLLFSIRQMTNTEDLGNIPIYYGDQLIIEWKNQKK